MCHSVQTRRHVAADLRYTESMPPRVIRQQVSFTPRQLAALERLAAHLERTKAELVRDALERFLADPPRPVRAGKA